MIILWRRGTYARINVSYCVGLIFTDLTAYIEPLVCVPSDRRKFVVLAEDRVFNVITENRTFMVLA
jgi:hypothetical protein